MRHDLFISGYGGQGVLLAGNVISYAALHEGNNVSFLPAYGVEKRGGAAMCTIVFSNEDTGSPVVGEPSVALLLNQLSFDKYASKIRNGGMCIANSSLVDSSACTRNDITIIPVPMNQLAIELGDVRMLNMVACGAYCAASNAIATVSLEAALKKALPQRNHKLIPANLAAIHTGFKAVSSKKA